jgi:hypothetical protein
VNRRRLLELGLYSSTLTTLTAVAWWFWQGQVDPAWLASAAAMHDAGARLVRFLLMRELVLALAMAEFLLGLAGLLALTPLGWWLESELIPQPEASPVQLLAHSIRKARAAQKAAAQAQDALPDNGPDPVSQPVTPPGSPIPGDSSAPGVPGHPSNASAQHQGVEQPPQPGQPAPPGQPPIVPQQPGQSQPAQPPGQQPQATQQPGQPQAPQPGQPQAAPQPGQPQTPAQPGQPQAGQQPGQPQPGQAGQPAPPQSALQALEMTPAAEESPLDALADVSDLLSVFDDDTGVEQWLLDLSEGLEDVEVKALATMSQQVLRDLRAQRSANSRAKAAPSLSLAL